MFFRTDIPREAAVRACVRAVAKCFGRLDALVNNAGIANPDHGPVEKLDLRDWTGQNFVVDGGMTKKMIYV